MSFDRRPDRFEDIVENIDRIRQHLTKLEGPLIGDPLVMDAVERCLSRVSEAVSVLLRAGVNLDRVSPDIPWRDIHDIGNRLRHEYRTVRSEIISNTVYSHLDDLRAAAAYELERLDREAGL